jgi:hypothetical protein
MATDSDSCFADCTVTFFCTENFYAPICSPVNFKNRCFYWSFYVYGYSYRANSCPYVGAVLTFENIFTNRLTRAPSR